MPENRGQWSDRGDKRGGQGRVATERSEGWARKWGEGVGEEMRDQRRGQGRGKEADRTGKGKDPGEAKR